MVPSAPQPSCCSHPGRGAPLGTHGPAVPFARAPARRSRRFLSAPPGPLQSAALRSPRPWDAFGLFCPVCTNHPLSPGSFSAAGNINLKNHQMSSFSEPWTAASCLPPCFPAQQPALQCVGNQSHCPVRLPSLDRRRVTLQEATRRWLSPASMLPGPAAPGPLSPQPRAWRECCPHLCGWGSSGPGLRPREVLPGQEPALLKLPMPCVDLGGE